MSAIDTAREIAKIAVTSGLSSEIIGLLEKKVALLTAQVTSLTENLALSESENLNLKQKVYDLEQEIDRLRPKKGGLEEGAEAILKVLFEHGRPLSIEQIAGST